MSEPIPVLLITPVGAPGGAERVLVGLARHLPSLGFAPSAVILGRGPIEGWFADVGCPVTVIDAGRGRAQQALRMTGVVLRLRRLIHDRGCALVISSLAKGHAYGGMAAAIARVPAVYWQHGIPRRRLLDVAARVVPAAAVVCGCDAAVSAQIAQTPRALVRKVHPGVDLAAIQERAGAGAALRRQLGWADNELVVGIVGRLEPWKGQRTFLTAVARVAVDHPDARYAIVGGALIGYEGSYPRELEQMAKDLGLADRVLFAGHQSDVYPWYEALDVVVHASDEPEPFGLVLVEAMVLSAPVIATAGGGPLEIIEDEESGLLVPIGDVAAMATAIGRLLDDRELRARLGRAARRRAAMFGERQMGEGFANVLREAMGPVRGPRTP